MLHFVFINPVLFEPRTVLFGVAAPQQACGFLCANETNARVKPSMTQVKEHIITLNTFLLHSHMSLTHPHKEYP